MSCLPEDILLIVFGYTDIDTFLNLRLLSREINCMIAKRMSSLSRYVARTTFPQQAHMLQSRSEAEACSSEQCLRWLKQLRFEQLASIILEWQLKGRVSAEDPLADPLRAVLSKGWAVTAQLSKIARDVMSTEANDLVSKDRTVNSTETTVEQHRLRELHACRIRLQYVETLSLDQLLGYGALRNGFGLPQLFGSGSHDIRVSRFAPDALVHPSWIFSCIARIGPEPFWKTWWASSHTPEPKATTPKKLLETAWKLGPRESHTVEAHGIDVLDFQVSRILGCVQNSLWTSKPEQQRPPKEISTIMRGPTIFTTMKERAQCSQQGAPRVFDELSIEQRLDSEFIPTPEEQAEASWNIGSNCRGRQAVQPIDNGDKIHGVTPEFKEIYGEWEQAWIKRRGWEEIVRVLKERIRAENLSADAEPCQA